MLLVFSLVNEVPTGIQAGSYYIGIDVALSSVDYIMRETNKVWSFGYLHYQCFSSLKMGVPPVKKI